MSENASTASTQDEAPRVKRLQAPRRRRRRTTPLDAWEGYTAAEVVRYLDGDFDVLSCEDVRCDGARIARPG